METTVYIPIYSGDHNIYSDIFWGPLYVFYLSSEEDVYVSNPLRTLYQENGKVSVCTVQLSAWFCECEFFYIFY